MSATAHLSRLAPSRPPRDTYLTRLRIRLRHDGPDRRIATVTCAPRLCQIAGRLEGNGAVAALGVAQAAMLVHEGDSPLYAPQIPDVALNRRLADVDAAL
jgi:hypothetical protein